MNRFWTIRIRFLLFGLLSLVPLIGFNWLLISNNNSDRVEDLTSSETVLASQMANSVSGYIGSVFRGLENLASNPVIIEHSDADAASNMLAQSRAVRPEFTGLFLLDENGNLISQAGTVDSSILPAIDSQIDSVLATGQRSVSGRIDIPLDPPTSVIVILVPVSNVSETTSSETTNITATAASGQPDMVATPTVSPPGTIRGVLGAVIPTDALAQQLLPASRGKSEVIVLAGQQVVISTNDIRTNETQWIENLVSQGVSFSGEGAESFRYQSLSGIERSAVMTPVSLETVSWSVMVTAAVPETQLTGLWEQMLALLMVAAFVYLIVSFVFGELITRSLFDLTESAHRLAEGDFKTPISGHGSGDLADLRDALVQLRDHTEEIMRENEEGQAERSRQNEQLRDLLRRDLRMQEDERRHIASEIHDAVSPLITGALYQSRALQRANGGASPEMVQESLGDVNDLLERASEELHGIIFDLRPPDLDDLGVVAAIEAFVSTIQRTGLHARLEVIDEPPPLTPEVRLGIYRIVQEALHNVLRHAGADEAVVRLEYVNSLLRVTIRDNGAGFDPNKARRPTSLGLLSMRERAAAIDADFEILSRPGGGTVIIVERRDTGGVMSDALLETILRDRTGDTVEDSSESAHNSDDERPEEDA
ncbi:MAG: hypothetical protein KC435_06815 [Thermomicrobiales bacterium]|nr:hypothetical protein [Thermomicrobiales bacterium]